MQLLPNNEEECRVFAATLKEWLKENVQHCESAMKVGTLAPVDADIDFDNLASLAAKQFWFPYEPEQPESKALKEAAQTKQAAKAAADRAAIAKTAATNAAMVMAEAKAKAASLTGIMLAEVQATQVQATQQAVAQAQKDAEEKAVAATVAQNDAEKKAAAATEARKHAEKLVNATVNVLVVMMTSKRVIL